MNKKLIFFGFLLLFFTACQNSETNNDKQTKEEAELGVPETLPLNQLDLSGLQLPANWQTAGSAVSDLNTENDLQVTEGSEVLACIDKGEHLNTGIEHGDVELEVQVMMPKGSNSGLYFQGRYEVQLFDSWKKTEVGLADMGGIYGHTFDEATGETSGGSPPAVNGAKAPGLWQNLKILFRAPQFDEQGNKTANAKFEWVYLNGFLIQENFELEKPTIAHMLEGEAPTGPLMIQGDHGPVAFKNIKYKRMGTDTVAISELSFSRYQGHWDYIPDFESLTPDTTGTTASMADMEEIAGQRDKFGMVFTGEIEVPKDGDYLFTTLIDDGGDLFIDSTLVVHNLGEPGIGTERGIINLKKGKHSFRLTFFEEVWLALAVVYVEGPEMPKKTLASVDVTKLWGSRNTRRAKVGANEKPTLVRGFVDYKGGKKTHALTVGDPSGVHYCYDLLDGALLKSWRGEFADVTNMWVGRGQSQTMLPENAAAEFSDGVPVAQLNSEDSAWPDFRSTDYKNKGFRLDAEGRPVFLSSFKGMQIEDQVTPSGSGGLKRSLAFSTDSNTANHYFRIARAGEITKLANGLYSIDGEYYLQVEEDSKVTIRNSELEDELIATVDDQLKYELIW